MAKGIKKGGLYALEVLRNFALSAISQSGFSHTIWHHHLGHANSRVL